MSRAWILLSLIALCAAGALAVRDAVRPVPVNVIVLTVESWRADAATPERMPNLYRAARRGVTFKAHRTISAWTAPNVIAVLTGVSPFRQGIHARGHGLPAEYDLLTEHLASRGWDVGGVQSFMLIDLFENLGLTIEPGTDLFSWVSLRARKSKPFFAWYHYLDSHLPYDPSGAGRILERFRGATKDELDRRARVRDLPAIPEGEIAFEEGDRDWIEALYHGGFEDFDVWFARFWAFFDASGLAENTILIVTADHGEELLERGNVGHASTTRAGHLHEEIVNVPLFVWAPADLLPVAPGSVVTQMTDHLMIAPAIAGMLGGSGYPDFDSAGLFAEPRRDLWLGLTSKAGFSEENPEEVTDFFAAALRDDVKVQATFRGGRETMVESWNLARDPAETGTAAAPAERAARLAQLLRDEMEGIRLPSPKGMTSASVGGLPAPDWVHPTSGGRVGYKDIAGQAYLAWTGSPSKSYVVEYAAGSGLLALGGTIDVAGTRYDFGDVSEGYWATWVVPYGHVRFRVRHANAGAPWSEWLELELQP